MTMQEYRVEMQRLKREEDILAQHRAFLVKASEEIKAQFTVGVFYRSQVGNIFVVTNSNLNANVFKSCRLTCNALATGLNPSLTVGKVEPFLPLGGDIISYEIIPAEEAQRVLAQLR